MFRPSEIIIDAFIARLRRSYGQIYGDGEPGHSDAISLVTRMALARVAQTDALYHNLDHTLQVTMVGHDILRGQIVRDGRLESQDWVNFVCSLVCFATGFYRYACPGDDENHCVIDTEGTTVEMPRGVSNGWLWKYFTDRSKVYVRHHYSDHPVVDVEAVMANIDYARFPPPVDIHPDTATYPGLLRASHIIGSVADPNFLLKMPSLVQELEESGMTKLLGYTTVAEFRTHYPELFWETLHPLILEAAELLKFTSHGREWLANMRAHLHSEEHRGDV